MGTASSFTRDRKYRRPRRDLYHETDNIARGVDLTLKRIPEDWEIKLAFKLLELRRLFETLDDSFSKRSDGLHAKPCEKRCDTRLVRHHKQPARKCDKTSRTLKQPGGRSRCLRRAAPRKY